MNSGPIGGWPVPFQGERRLAAVGHRIEMPHRGPEVERRRCRVAISPMSLHGADDLSIEAEPAAEGEVPVPGHAEADAALASRAEWRRGSLPSRRSGRSVVPGCGRTRSRCRQEWAPEQATARHPACASTWPLAAQRARRPGAARRGCGAVAARAAAARTCSPRARKMPFTASLIVPSPPSVNSISWPSAAASLASSAAWPR